MIEGRHPDPLKTFDWARFESPVVGVVTAVAEESGNDPVEMEPLYEAIDPDSLDRIAPILSESRDSDAHIEFEYHGYRIVVESNGRGYLYR